MSEDKWDDLSNWDDIHGAPRAYEHGPFRDVVMGSLFDSAKIFYVKSSKLAVKKAREIIDTYGFHGSLPMDRHAIVFVCPDGPRQKKPIKGIHMGALEALDKLRICDVEIIERDDAPPMARFSNAVLISCLEETE